MCKDRGTELIYTPNIKPCVHDVQRNRSEISDKEIIALINWPKCSNVICPPVRDIGEISCIVDTRLNTFD